MFTTHADCETLELSGSKRNKSTIKPILILTTLFFLIIAPEPDSRVITEMTANFLVPANHSALLASTEPPKPFQEKSQ